MYFIQKYKKSPLSRLLFTVPTQKRRLFVYLINPSFYTQWLQDKQLCYSIVSFFNFLLISSGTPQFLAGTYFKFLNTSFAERARKHTMT